MRNDTSDHLSPAALKAQLLEELSKNPPDQAAVSRLLDALAQHDPEAPVPAGTRQELDTIWQDYKAARDNPDDTNKQKTTSRQIILKLSAAAALLAIVLCVTPAVAGASSLCEFFASWDEKTFSFLPTTKPTETQEPYTFQTDHPGLQQVYDAVTQLGITDPVVPMWIPEGYHLDQLEAYPLQNGYFVFALLENESSSISLTLQTHLETGSSEYIKDSAYVETVEYFGTIHYILSNNQENSALWKTSDLECALSVCGDDTDIKKILLSIYQEAN